MTTNALTGRRIRARRLDLGIRQIDLAQACGISPSYLNLIEHDRRRIAGKLLIDIARELDVDAGTLADGADRQIVQELTLAAAEAGGESNAQRAGEFASRYPEWAQVTISLARRVATLEQAVETLSDRLVQDPFLAASLHDILTSAAAIRSTSSILAEEKDVDPAWQARFHRNLHEDSARLAEAGQALAAYLDAGSDAQRRVSSPQEEFQEWLEAQDFRIAAIEEADDPAEARLPATAFDGLSSSARPLAEAFVAQYRGDARALPEAALREAVAATGPDPVALSARFAVPYAVLFRRLACLSGSLGWPNVGLAACDASGTLILRKAPEGFPLPTFGAACPLWPMFEALSRPSVPLKRRIVLAGRPDRQFRVFAIADPEPMGDLDAPPVLRAHMLLLPIAPAETGEAPVVVGTSCRICPRSGCRYRREPSVIGETA